MRKFSVRRILTLRGRTLDGFKGWSGEPLYPSLTDSLGDDEPMEEHMSRAEWLAAEEEAVTYRSPDPLADSANNGDVPYGGY